MNRVLGLSLGLAALIAGTAFAADVKVSGLHNCCGQCTTGIQKALKEGGATNVVLNKRELSFSADDADKAVKALYDAGYAGKVTGAKTPEIDAKAPKSTTVKLAGLHNCCGQCTTGINDALKGIGTTDAKSGATTVTVTAKSEVEAAAVVKALRDAGFNAHVAK